MKGYLIKDKKNNYLSKDLSWFPHEKDSDAWVHPKNILENLINCGAYTDWESSPHSAIPAIHDEFEGVKITGEQIEINS